MPYAPATSLKRLGAARQSSLYGQCRRQLPAPPGHWMPISLCEVYREAYDSPCEATEAGTLGFCEKRRDQCPFVADVCDASGGCVPPEGCTPATFVQPCDWRRDPSLLGQRVYQFPGQPIDIDLPYACYAGILGSADATMQGSRLCAGACPSGKQCPAAATFEALDCEPGVFPCPAREWRIVGDEIIASSRGVGRFGVRSLRIG